MLRQGCPKTQLKRILGKQFGKRFETFKVLASTAKSFIQLFQLI